VYFGVSYAYNKTGYYLPKKKVVSRLNINLAKSELVLASKVDNVDWLVGILSCGVSSLPLKNLSLSLGSSYKAKSI
jgi:hypothetical protein